jgi:hypothetical protein
MGAGDNEGLAREREKYRETEEVTQPQRPLSRYPR